VVSREGPATSYQKGERYSMINSNHPSSFCFLLLSPLGDVTQNIFVWDYQNEQKASASDKQ
jgi:hypothetical protein